MYDQRNDSLAHMLVNYSCGLKSGEKVYIQCNGIPAYGLVKAVVREVYKVGGQPFVWLIDPSIQRQILMECTTEVIQNMASYTMACMQQMQAYIGIRAYDNGNELIDVPAASNAIYAEHYVKPVHLQYRVNNTKWAVLRYPTAGLAQAASMSQEGFEDYFFRVCVMDYKKMSQSMEPLVKLMSSTDKVRIVGPGTDLKFSIKGVPVVKCDGLRNIPDGEVYTAPVRDSLNGKLAYNCPSLCEDDNFTYDNISFEFKNGKIVKATANDTPRLNKLLDTDDGSRFIGEFALGVNPFITKPMKDSLFDEKISGSFHLTPGQCYKAAFNGNNSAIHWDLVCIQTPEFGGGQIYFDGVLVRDNGRFVVESLSGLNPENLK
ncbi:MAG: aminopeptidase [Chitinivibrionales bacterium]|nr:aminopeptidase [Chitinivibrionales bacterium]